MKFLLPLLIVLFSNNLYACQAESCAKRVCPRGKLCKEANPNEEYKCSYCYWPRYKQEDAVTPNSHSEFIKKLLLIK